MNSKNFLLTFVTPEKEILKEQTVEEILCPAETGQLNILPQHAPLISLLDQGILSYKIHQNWKSFWIDAGFLEVHPKGVRVLAETAKNLKDHRHESTKNL